MYKIFKGFAQVATAATKKEVKATLTTLTGGVVNVISPKGRRVYSAYHFEAGAVAHGWV